MSTATAMLTKLTEAGLSEDKSRAIIKAEIASGSITADGDFVVEEDVIGKADVKAIEAAATAISKAMEVGNKKADTIAKADSEEKEEYDEAESSDAGDDEEEEEAGAEKSLNSSEDYDVVAILSKGADQILDSVETQNKTLAKGYLAIRDTFSNFADILNKASERIATLEGTVDSLHKALGQPVPPRSVSGAVEAVPSPGEAAIAKANIDNSTFSTPELMAKAKSIMADTKDSTRLYQLSMAVAELESGAQPESVAVRYGIAVH